VTLDRARLQARVNFIFQVPVHRVLTVGAVSNEVTSWWMVRSLFQVDLCAVLLHTLVSLTQDWVEWLRKLLLVVEPGNVGTHDILHTLDRIRAIRSLRHVDW